MQWNQSENEWTCDIWIIRKSGNLFTLLYAGFNEYCYFDQYESLELAKETAEDFISAGKDYEKWKKLYQQEF